MIFLLKLLILVRPNPMTGMMTSMVNGKPPRLPIPNIREFGLLKIDNPEYKGPWVHPQIDNPEYKDDPELYAFDSFKYLGIDIWQVKSGSIFGHFLLTDDWETAKTQIDEINKIRDGEKKKKEEQDEKERLEREAQEAARKAEEEAKKAEDDGKGEDEDDEDKAEL